MSARILLEGKRFGRWVVGEYRGINANDQTIYSCDCDCGTRRDDVVAQSLRSGLTMPCGCTKGQAIAAKRTRHGHSRVRGTGEVDSRTYSSWQAMHGRCAGRGDSARAYYLARGITVCERWSKFENFLADMGERPPGTTLDRKDNELGYSPDNCRWATKREQANNRRRHGSLASPNLAKRLMDMPEIELLKLFELLPTDDLERFSAMISDALADRTSRAA